MRIGIDLDNTIISYDAVFHFAALGHGLISPHVPARKTAVKHYIQKRHGEDAWTRLQAEAYGPLLEYAQPFDGVMNFFQHCRTAQIPICILSHKSCRPALGEPYDLRAAALAWLETQGWFSSSGAGLTPTDVEFHDTRAEKIQAIARWGCDVFIDDLPEVLADSGFPSRATRILFDPDQSHPHHPEWKHACTWAAIKAETFTPVAA